MANDIEFIIFYTALIVFIIYVGGISGYGILQASDLEICSTTITENCIDVEYSLNPISALQTFGILLTVNSTYLVIFSLVFTPYLIGLVWIFLKWLRGTG